MTCTHPDPGRAGHLPDPGRQNDRPVYVCDGILVRICMLAVESADRVRLRLGEGHGMLPNRVVLVDPRTGHSRQAAVIWRSEAEAGVRFLERGARYRVLRSTADLARDADVLARRAS